MSTVTFNGIRLSSADSNSGWGNFNASGPSPAAEPQLKYQGANAINKKVTSTNSRSGVRYVHGASIDMTAVSYPLWVCKMKVGDAGDLNTAYGCEAAIGSGTSAYYSYNLSGSTANNDQFTNGYSSQGGLAEGYIIAAINPNVSQWREGTSGNPSLTGVDFFGVAAQFVTGGAKSENVACDAIDLGVGLDYSGADFSFEDGANADQDATDSRWGFACRNGSVISLRGLHRLGPGGSISGTDTSACIFVDGYHGTGDAGISVDLSNAATSLTLAGSYTGLGRVYGSDDTRPDLTVNAGIGALSLSGSFENFRRAALTGGVTLTGTLSVSELVQGGASMSGARLSINTAPGIAACSDADFTKISGTTILQAGTGHAFELTTPGTYGLTALSFDGFGTGNSAAIFNNSGGVVTLNISGGNTPTVRNGAGASTLINNAVSVTLTGLFSGTRVKVYRQSDNAELAGVESSASSFTAGLEAGEAVTFRLASLMRRITEFDLTVPSNDTTIPVSQQLDRVYENG